MAAGEGQVLSSTYKWEIANYSSYSDLETGKYIHSPTFNVHSRSWNLYLYRNGETKDTQGYISLYLHLNEDIQDDIEIQTRFAFSLINSKKDVIQTHITESVILFCNCDRIWGRPNFMDRSLVKNNRNLISSDKITIVCEVIIEEANTYKTILMPTPDRMQHFEAFKSLINNEKFSDVKFIVENKEILAHKVVLAANSTVFAAMFEHQMRENLENVVKIEDINYKVFNELLRFVYTGECTLRKDIVSELFEAADKYELFKLKNVCEEELCKSISINNVMAFLQLADMHGAERLKKEAIDFIALHGKEMIDKPEFEPVGNLNTQLLKDVFREVFARIN